MILLFKSLAELYRYRELSATWILREINARYRQTLFGFAWALFQPIALSIMFAIVFSFILHIPSDGAPYPLFVFSAMVPWTFFGRSLTSGIPSVAYNQDLVRKIYFPREIFPIATIASGLVDLAAGSLVFIGMMLFYRVPLRPEMLLVIVLLVIQTVFTLGIVFAGSAVNVLIRDISQVMPLLTQLWMYATPIVYPLSLVPEKIRPFYLLNPMAVLIQGYRDLLLHQRLPDPTALATATGVALVVFLAGYWLFKRMELHFADFI